MLPENPTIAIVGLGYVGLPLAVEFGKHFSTIGFDLSTINLHMCVYQHLMRHVSRAQLMQTQHPRGGHDRLSNSGDLFCG